VFSEKGNEEAMVGLPPWYVKILYLKDSKYLSKCGGFIIAPNVVISGKFFV